MSMVSVCSSETSVNVWRTTCSNNPEESNQHYHHYKDLKSNSSSMQHSSVTRLPADKALQCLLCPLHVPEQHKCAARQCQQQLFGSRAVQCAWLISRSQPWSGGRMRSADRFLQLWVQPDSNHWARRTLKLADNLFYLLCFQELDCNSAGSLVNLWNSGR